ncbi:21 kDa protein-like [Humulus lupulus]|uniref:21 kDa protein-like n=1 Tax=Humulus lupulus TaxID=3486 RepID=UPI002B4090C4|nr:21 kDa protein-like [Humulus lupulus]
MAKAINSFVPFLALLICIVGAANSAATGYRSPVTTSNFVKWSCSSTTYPRLCIRTLSTFSTKIQNSPHQLALTALNVSLDTAKSAKGFVLKLGKFKGLKKMEYKAIADCIDEMGESVDRLGDSVKELKNMGKYKGQDFMWHMSNVQTWVSAALTDDNTCLDGFAGRSLNGKIKSSIRAQVVNVAQLTSNALALCNRFAKKN